MFTYSSHRDDSIANLLPHSFKFYYLENTPRHSFHCHQWLFSHFYIFFSYQKPCESEYFSIWRCLKIYHTVLEFNETCRHHERVSFFSYERPCMRFLPCKLTNLLWNQLLKQRADIVNGGTSASVSQQILGGSCVITQIR